MTLFLWLWNEWFIRLIVIKAKHHPVIKVTYIRDGVVGAIYLTDRGGIRNRTLNGVTEAMLREPSVGTECIKVNTLRITEVTPYAPDAETQDRINQFRNLIIRLSQTLMWDEHIPVFIGSRCDSYHIGRNFNYNECGFTAKAVDGRHVFFEWSLLPLYRGRFEYAPVVKQTEDFIYYSWMSNQIRDIKNMALLPPSEENDKLSDFIRGG